MNTTANTTTITPADTGSLPAVQQRPSKPEPRLLAALRRQADWQGHTQIELAHHLGVTSGYLMQLRSGTRDVSRISLDFARACAAYLDTSTLNVLLLAGTLDIGDFSAPSNPQRRITEGLHAMLEDPVYAPFIDEPLFNSLSAEVQNLLVSLYEEASQREFGMSRVLPPILWSSQRLATQLAAEDLAQAEAGDAAPR